MCRAMNVLCKPYRIALVLALGALLSAWTCTAVVNLDNCRDAVPHPQIGALSLNPISADIVSGVLSVEGMGFCSPIRDPVEQIHCQPRSSISRHLQATVTQRTFDSFGGSAGESVLISVVSSGNNSVVDCPNRGNSSTVILEVD